MTLPNYGKIRQAKGKGGGGATTRGKKRSRGTKQLGVKSRNM